MSRLHRIVAHLAFTVAIALALTAAVGATPAAAADTPGAGNGCPTPAWHLFTVAFVLQHVPDPNGFPSWDVNGDGYTCVLFVAGENQSVHDMNRVVIVDNTLPH